MAGEVERSGEPAAGLHIELTAAEPPNLENCALESLGIHGDAIPHSPEIGEIEDQRVEAGNGPWRRAPEAVGGRPLPRDKGKESNGPDEREQSAVE